MLRVTIEVIPSFSPDKPETIATAIIINNGTGTKELGNYDVRFNETGRTSPLEVSVTEFPRLAYGPWGLLLAALNVPAEQLRKNLKERRLPIYPMSLIGKE